jgi:hypothetical protein
MLAMSNSNPPARHNGRVVKSLICQRSGGFLQIWWIFPATRMRACARAHDTTID